MYRTRFSCQTLLVLELSGQIFRKKNPQISNLIKTHPVATELFHRTDGRDNADVHRNKNFSNIYLLQFFFLPL